MHYLQDEGEYLAAGSCCSQMQWMIQTLKYFKIKKEKVPIHCENTSTINIFKNLGIYSKTKHIDVRHFHQDFIERKIVSTKKETWHVQYLKHQVTY